MRLTETTLLRAAGGAFLLVLTAGAATAACPESDCQKPESDASVATRVEIRPEIDTKNGVLRLVSRLVGDDDKDDKADKAAAKKLRGGAAHPLGAKGGEAVEGQAQTWMRMSQADGDNNYSVSINGDDVSAEVNGKPVPADRIKNENGKVTILDEDGKPLTTFHVGGLGQGGVFAAPKEGQWWGRVQPEQRGRVLRINPELNRLSPEGQGGAVQIAPENPPPVMVGITMGEPDQSVLDFLGIESGIRLDRVVEGLPAAQAGLKEGDLVVGINGSQGASAEQLREVLHDSKAGDDIKLTVVRKGEGKKTYTISLVAWDASKLGVQQMPQVEVQGEEQPQGRQPWIVTKPFKQGDWDEVQRRLEESLARVKGEADIDKLKKEVSESLRQAMKALSKAREEASQQFRGMQIDPERLWNEGGKVRVFGDRPGEVFAMPQEGDRSPQDVERLNNRMDKLEKRLDQIIEILKEHKDRQDR